MSDETEIKKLIEKRENKIKLLTELINSTSYKNTLINTNIISSVNCKEWEEEKKYFNEIHDKSLIPILPATRHYFTINKENVGLEHLHEGHIDFRPTGTISDAFLPIPQKEKFFVTCRKSYKSDDPFNSIPIIVTVPYTTPEPKLSLCSASTLWIVLVTLCNEFGKEYISLREINNSLPVRSRGGAVGLREYTSLFEKYNFGAHFYIGSKKKKLYNYLDTKLPEWEEKINNDVDYFLIQDLYNSYRESESDQDFTQMNSKILYAYIESEIPVYLVFDADVLAEELGYSDAPVDYYHSVAAIGHTLDEKSNLLNFIIHDVNQSPFVEISEKFVNENLYEATVLLPKEVKVKYEYFLQNSEDSDTIKYSETIEYLISLCNFIDRETLMNRQLKIRPFLMRSQRIKFWFTNKSLYPTEICDIYSKADFPPYVWFFEIWNLDLEDNRKCIGHIVFDATISEDSTGLVLINFPRLRMWSQNNEKMKEIPEIPTFHCLHPFRHSYKTSENQKLLSNN